MVGFDLDGTLYKNTPEIDNRVRMQIAHKLLNKCVSLDNINSARDFFEKRYAEIQSGTGVLREVGYEDASATMDDCLANADVVNLIEFNPELNEILRGVNSQYVTYILTSSPMNLSLSKLEKIGIADIFDFMFFGDNPIGLSKSKGTAFDYAINQIGFSGEDYIYIGDRLNSDILPAKNKGMSTVAVWKNISEADYYIENIKDIGELIL